MAGETMRAVRAYGPGDYRLETLPRPRPGPGELVLRVEAAGICGSDGKCFSGGAMFWGERPWVKAPVTPGHEFVGVVDAVGPGAERFGLRPGDRAVAEQIYPCDECRYCLRGQYWMCEVHDIYGFQGGVADGAWAEYMRLGPRSRVHRVPASLAPEAAALIEPLACAIHAVERAGVQLGDTAVVAGAGPLGLLMLQVLRLKGPGRVVVCDARPERLAAARALGAEVCLNVLEQDAAAAVRDLTDGYGADVYIEASGAPSAVAAGLEMLRKLGTYVCFGVFREKASVDWSIIGDRKELNVLGAHLGPYCYPRAIEYLKSGTVDHRPLVTHRLGLERFAEGLELVLSGGGIKVVLLPGG